MRSRDALAANQSNLPSPAANAPVGGAVLAWAGFALLLLICGTARQPSPDLWWQLAGGREMIGNGVFPLTDRFSFTAGDARWFNHEWLAECWMYWLYRAGGVVALHAARLGVLFLVFWTAARVARRLGCSESVAAIAASLAMIDAQWRFFFDVRPYLFTYLGLAASYHCATSCLVGRPGGERRAIVWLAILPLIFVLWANLHSGVIAGLALLAALSVGARSLPLLAATTACALATLANPYGAHVLVFPFHFLRGGVWSRGLNEWVRPDLLHQQWTFTVYLAFVWGCAALAWRRLGAAHLLALAGFTVLACSAWRHLTLLAIVSVPAVAGGLEALLSMSRARERIRVPDRVIPLAVAMALCGCLAWIARTDFGALGMERELFPVDAVRFLRAHPLPSRMLNPYGWGGYFDWTLAPRYRVFMDGRANTLFPESVYADFLSIGSARPGWDALLARYEVPMVIVNGYDPGTRSLAAALEASPQWARVYQDDIASIYLHREDSTRRLLAEVGAWWRPPAARLADARAAVSVGRVDEAEAAARAVLAAAEGPKDGAAAHGVLALVDVRRGRPAEAERELEEAIALDPTLPELHFNLAMLLARRGDRAGAIAALRDELRVNPEFPLAEERLRQLEGAK
jgi:tetratricopeptide (TPR) repeat protein